jgi:predicted GIY-YIG superfamily endonuclease
MSWIVYLLVSRSIDFYNHTYVGITKDLNRRLNQHNGVITGGAKSTRAKRPYEVAIYIGNISNRSIASQMEFQIKSQKGYVNRYAFMEDLKKIEN